MQKKTKRGGFSFKYIPCYIARAVLPILHLIFRTRVYLSEDCPGDIRKIKGGALLIANHSNFSDPLIITDVFWRRRLRYIMGENIIDKPVRGFLYRQLGCIRLDRNSVDFDCVKSSVKLLRDGELLTVFPEGGLHLRVAEVSEFKSGASLMAVIAGVPIIPMYIAPKMKKLSRVRVMIGAPVDPVSVCGRFPSADGLQRLSEELRARVCALKAELETK